MKTVNLQFDLLRMPRPAWLHFAALAALLLPVALAGSAAVGQEGAKVTKGKTLAVVVRLADVVSFSRPFVADELAEEVSAILQANGNNVQIISPAKVAKWVDENQWHEFTEVAKAVQAETVVGIDLETFSLFQGQTLYQGKADLTIRLYDVANDNKLVFEKGLRPVIYPSDAGIPTPIETEFNFRREYVGSLADLIVRHFYEHESQADIAAPCNTGRDAALVTRYSPGSKHGRGGCVAKKRPPDRRLYTTAPPTTLSRGCWVRPARQVVTTDSASPAPTRRDTLRARACSVFNGPLLRCTIQGNTIQHNN